MLHLTLSLERGGRRDAIITLARELVPLGVSSTAVALRGGAESLDPFRHEFDNLETLGLTGRPTLAAIRSLRRWCLEWGIDVVHAHDAASQFVASMLRIVAPSLHPIMTFHRSLGFESARRRDRIRNGASLVLVDRVVTASEERRRHFLAENAISSHKVQVIPLGIDLTRFRPDAGARAAARSELDLPYDSLLVLSMGHFGEEKGIDQAVRAVADARNRLPGRDIKLLVLGTGSPERVESIHALGHELLGSAVIFGGHRPDPERWFRAADLFLHTPRVEAFGLVVVQAMASGTAVVASAVGGIPEIVADGRTGVLVHDQDPASLGSAVADLLGDPARRTSVGEAAVSMAAARFAATRFAEDHRALYRELTGRLAPGVG